MKPSSSVKGSVLRHNEIKWSNGVELNAREVSAHEAHATITFPVSIGEPLVLEFSYIGGDPLAELNQHIKRELNALAVHLREITDSWPLIHELGGTGMVCE